MKIILFLCFLSACSSTEKSACHEQEILSAEQAQKCDSSDGFIYNP